MERNKELSNLYTRNVEITKRNKELSTIVNKFISELSSLEIDKEDFRNEGKLDRGYHILGYEANSMEFNVVPNVVIKQLQCDAGSDLATQIKMLKDLFEMPKLAEEIDRLCYDLDAAKEDHVNDYNELINELNKTDCDKIMFYFLNYKK